MTYYIISISDKFYPKHALGLGDSLLLKKFQDARRISSFPFNLSNGINERVYEARMPKDKPLTNKEGKEITEIADKQNKFFKVFRLEEIV